MPESFLREDLPYYTEAYGYFLNLLDGKRDDAIKIIYDLNERGVSIKDIYLRIFEPVKGKWDGSGI